MAVLRCKCPCKNPTNCSLEYTRNTCTLLKKPIKEKVFGLTPDYPYPPFHRRKLTNREIRDAVDKNELWYYTPPLQIPRVEITCLKCRQFIMRNTSMKKIICMARQNLSFNGPIGEMRVSIPIFGKAKIKSTLKEAHKKCQNMKMKNAEEIGRTKFKNFKKDFKGKKMKNSKLAIERSKHFKMSFLKGSPKSTNDSLKNVSGCDCQGGDCGQGCTNGSNQCNCNGRTVFLKCDYKITKVSTFHENPKPRCMKKDDPPDTEPKPGNFSLST